MRPCTNGHSSGTALADNPILSSEPDRQKYRPKKRPCSQDIYKKPYDSDLTHYNLIPIIPAIADGGMINTNCANFLAVGKTIEAVVDSISIYTQVRAINPMLGRKIVPKADAPDNKQIRLVLIHHFEERLSGRPVLLRRSGLTRSLHGHLQVVVEKQRIPDPDAFFRRSLVIHQRTFKLEVGGHPPLTFVILIQIIPHDPGREIGALRTETLPTIPAGFTTVMAIPQNHNPLSENTSGSILRADPRTEEYSTQLCSYYISYSTTKCQVPSGCFVAPILAFLARSIPMMRMTPAIAITAHTCAVVITAAAETAAVAPVVMIAVVAPTAKTDAGNFDAAIKINSVFVFVGIKVVSPAFKALLMSDTFETFAIIYNNITFSL